MPRNSRTRGTRRARWDTWRRKHRPVSYKYLYLFLQFRIKKKFFFVSFLFLIETAF